MLFTLYSMAHVPLLVAASCECGYLARGIGQQDGPLLFTDILESDFTTLDQTEPLKSWVPQQFNVSAKAGRGKFGKTFSPDNVGLRPSPGGGDTDPSLYPSQVLELRVGSRLEEEAIPAAELDSARTDMHWGSYRAGMKLADVEGTCAAFFWVRVNGLTSWEAGGMGLKTTWYRTGSGTRA